ncbi:PREDICTED: uncharacterized protein LOC108375596, partial [Rhagoletis zephyria]|uniref:uncharacterized protein LOC108375596 n=1 Tax=Rhagoletis zephyria TaxID=28612 RepID=UPI000811418D
MKGKYTENLTRHIKREHADISEEIIGEKIGKNDSNQNDITQYIVSKPPSATVSVAKQDLVDGCIELVTKNGRPLKLMEDSGFRKIIDPLCKAVGISINRLNIKEEILKRAAKLRSVMTSKLDNRLLSIKVDCVSRLDRSIIGINPQYIENGDIIIHTLSMKQIFVKHTGLNLSNIIVDVLKSFEINMDRIYSITVDNAANMICVGKFLNKAQSFHQSQRLHIEEGNEVVDADSQ